MSILIHPLHSYEGNSFEDDTPSERVIQQVKMADCEKPCEPSRKLSIAMRSVLWTSLVLAILTIIVVVYKSF